MREDLWGVTGLMRALGLGAVCYDRLLDSLSPPRAGRGGPHAPVGGAFLYHFGTADMSPITRKARDQYLHRKTAVYRA